MSTPVCVRRHHKDRLQSYADTRLHSYAGSTREPVFSLQNDHVELDHNRPRETLWVPEQHCSLRKTGWRSDAYSPKA